MRSVRRQIDRGQRIAKSLDENELAVALSKAVGRLGEQQVITLLNELADQSHKEPRSGMMLVYPPERYGEYEIQIFAPVPPEPEPERPPEAPAKTASPTRKASHG